MVLFTIIAMGVCYLQYPSLIAKDMSSNPNSPFCPWSSSEQRCTLQHLRDEYAQGRRDELEAQSNAFQTFFNLIDRELMTQAKKNTFTPLRLPKFIGHAATPWGKGFTITATFDNVLQVLRAYKERGVLDLTKSTLSWYVAPPSIHVLGEEEVCKDGRHVHIRLYDGMPGDIHCMRTIGGPTILCPSEFKAQNAMYSMNIEAFLNIAYQDGMQAASMKSQFMLSFIEFHLLESAIRSTT